MKVSTALLLARPASRADRARAALVAGAVAAAGALLLAAAHIARMPSASNPADGPLANYVTESGLRPGVVIATLLLVVPVAALVVQALRLGSVARERRLASLRLAGATPGDVRAVAAFEAGGAAVAGGLLAGPAYLVLWLAVGVLAPAGVRMLDSPDVLDAAAWALLVPLCGVAGALGGAAVHRRIIVEPLGVRRRARPPAPGRASRVALIGGVVLVACGVLGVSLLAGVEQGGEALIFLVMIGGLLLAAFAGGTRLVLRCAGVLVRRGGAEALLAGRRLQAEPRSAGRAAGVLIVCGIVLGAESLLFGEQFLTETAGERQHTAFYLAGYGMAALAALTAAVVAVLTLLVAAADGLLDARRQTATLSALGVDDAALVRVLRRQLTATAVPAIVTGVILVLPALTLLSGVGGQGGFLWRPLLAITVTALFAALALRAAARLAARLLRPLIRAAIDPENLRVA